MASRRWPTKLVMSWEAVGDVQLCTCQEFEIIDKLYFCYGSKNSLLRNVYHVGKFNVSVCARFDPIRPLRLIKACTSSSPYQFSWCFLTEPYLSVCVCTAPLCSKNNSQGRQHVWMRSSSGRTYQEERHVLGMSACSRMMFGTRSTLVFDPDYNFVVFFLAMKFRKCGVYVNQVSFELYTSDLFLLPHSSGNRGKQSLSRAFASIFLASNPSVFNSTMFLPFLSNSWIPPTFRESLLRVLFNHKGQIQCVIGILQGVVLATPLEAASF